MSDPAEPPVPSDVSSFPDAHPASAEAETGTSRLFRWLNQAGNNYRLTRFIILRFTGLVYFVAFLTAAHQFIPLVGHNGLLPADLLVGRVIENAGSPWAAFKEAPSVFWFDCGDRMILAVTWAGVALSFVVLCGFANSIIMLVLWALYFSLLPIGQEWLAYGWDIQILETGFLGVMLAPLFDPRPFPPRAPPVLIIWLYRWMIFRIMIGAGLIKVRGDECWRDLTALYYHYETQPIPNPFSRFFHFGPSWFHKAGALWNHIVELAVPWFAFWPRIARHVAGVLMASFMGILIVSGNLSFLNWLTIIPALACLDDSFWRKVLPGFIVARAEASARSNLRRSEVQLIVSMAYALIVAWLSIGPVRNLLSPQQAMNTSFDRFHLVNTYGAFGTVDRERFEIIFEGTSDPVAEELADWKEYEFKAKPGNPSRRPVWISPYHYRLDWATWFPWSKVPGRQQWVPHFIWKLLHNDPGTLSLLANNPFPDKPPTYVRAVLYRYKFAPLGNKDGVWWTRERIRGLWIRPVTKDDKQLRQMIQQAGWLRQEN